MKDFFVETLWSGNLLIALPIALLAGLLSFLSPCVLPLVPGYVAYATGFATSKRKLLLGSTLFVIGFSAVFISYGLAFGGLGSLLAAHSLGITRALGLFTIFMGALFMGLFPFSPTIRPTLNTTGGIAGAPLLGALFGLGWTPCIGPALATVQTLAFTEASAVRGSILSLFYSLGLGAPFILSGLYLDRSARIRSFLVRRGDLITKIGGAALVVIGLLQVSGAWNSIMISLRSFVSDFVPVI